jgi:hypothetical protein
MDTTIKTDIMDNNFNKIMTIKYKKIVEDWKNENIHPLPCNCILCLWRTYIEIKKNKKGRPYDWLTFLVWDLIFEAKLAYLKEKGIARKLKSNDKETWEYPIGKLYGAPYKRRAKEILKQIPEFEDNKIFFLGLGEFINSYFERYAGKGRYERSTFLKLLGKLESEIHREWKKKQPDSPEKKKEWDRNWKDLKLAQGIANYICSQPRKRIKRRLLLRRFNIKVEDLEAIQGLLPNFGINYKEKEGYRNKTTIYYSTAKSSRGKYWRVGI